MSPIDFVIFNGDSKPNTPACNVANAMGLPIRIHSNNKEFEILSYYLNKGQMTLEIEEKKCHHKK